MELLNTQLKELDEKENRFAKMYGEGDHVMTERVYKNNVAELNDKRALISSELAGVKDQLANTPTLPLEKLVQGVVKLVEELDYSKKRHIIERVVSKVVATKEEVDVWGYIPVLAQKDDYTDHDKNDSQNQTQYKISSNPLEIGLDAKHRNRRLAECVQIHTF